MAVTISGTGITLNDSSVLTSATPAFGAIGSYAVLHPIQSVSSGATSGYQTFVDLSVGNTIAGSNLGANVKPLYAPTSIGGFGSLQNVANFAFIIAVVQGYNITNFNFPYGYSAQSGSWRAMSGCGIYGNAGATKAGYYRNTWWSPGLFMRYA